MQADIPTATQDTEDHGGISAFVMSIYLYAKPHSKSVPVA